MVMVSDSEAGRGQLHIRKSRRSVRGVEMAQARHRLEDGGHLLQMLPPNIRSSSCEERMGIKCLSHQFSSVAQLCPALCHPIDCSTPGLLVHHQLLEFSQTHVHHIGDAIQPSHPLSSPSAPTFNLSQHQGLFK